MTTNIRLNHLRRGGNLGATYLSVRDSRLGLFPNQDPIIVTTSPSPSNPDGITLHPVSIADVYRSLALVGAGGVLDIYEIDMPSENTHDRSWEDWEVEDVNGEQVLRWTAARVTRAKPWLAMPEPQGKGGYAVWYIDDFKGAFPGVTMPIDNIVLEPVPAK